MSPATGTAQWYKGIISAAERSTQGKALQNDLETLYAINGTPNGDALFTYLAEASDSGSFYFSPGAVTIARGLIQHFSGAPCPAPVADGDNDQFQPHARTIALAGYWACPRGKGARIPLKGDTENYPAFPGAEPAFS